MPDENTVELTVVPDVRAEKELENLHAQMFRQEGLLEYVAMMGDVELPDSGEQEGPDAW